MGWGVEKLVDANDISLLQVSKASSSTLEMYMVHKDDPSKNQLEQLHDLE